MIVVNLGRDELENYDIEHLVRTTPDGVSIERLYYWYRYEEYDGTGTAVYQDSNVDWHTDYLGHCSCNGPFEDGFNRIPYTRKYIIHGTQ